MIWIALAIGFVVLVVLFCFALFSVTKREDWVARHAEKSADPFSDVDITRPGYRAPNQREPNRGEAGSPFEARE